MKLVRLFCVALFAMAFCMTSCSPEDGKDGIDGIDGTNGIDGINGQDGADGQDGTDGADGQNGADGVGFDELAKFGHITLELEGTRADNVAFQDSTSFKFMHVENFEFYNSVTSSMVGDDLVYSFDIRRFFSSPDDIYQESYMDIFLEIANPGEESETLSFFSYNINEYSVVGSDGKYFYLDHGYNNFSLEITNLEISDVAYDTETNHLTFSYTFTVNALANATGNDLNMSGTVDVIMLEEIDVPQI